MRRLLCALALCAACVRPGEERAASDLEIGRAADDQIAIDIADGLGHVRELESREVRIWAQAPILTIDVDVAVDAEGQWTFTVDNALPDAELTGVHDDDPIVAIGVGGPRPTRRIFETWLPAGRSTLRLAPPDEADRSSWRFAALADIQDALPIVDQVYARISAQPGIRFVVSMGDIVQRGWIDEYDLYEEQLGALDIPCYSTIGNHELWNDHRRWAERFGRFNVHFTFRGVTFSLIDSGSATIDPIVDEWLDDWLAEAKDRIHVFATHYPPIDPVGVRQGSFASQREGAQLLARLAAAGVDLTLYGHIHTYLKFDNAGIPAFISGGGGADPMKLDNVGRHFLIVEVAPEEDRVVRVDRVDVDE